MKDWCSNLGDPNHSLLETKTAQEKTEQIVIGFSVKSAKADKKGRKSDALIVAMTIETTKLYQAKGCNLNSIF